MLHNQRQKRIEEAMTDSELLNVDEVAELIGVSRSYACRVIRKLNEELTASGHYVVRV